MEGTDENPDDPRGVGGETPPVVAIPVKKRTSGYPIEESLRPITLPRGMSEISLSPSFQVDPFIGGDSLRGRYGITRQVQLGLTYAVGSFMDDPATPNSDKLKFFPGKALGLDVTVLIQSFLGVRVGVPVNVDPLAIGVNVGVPMRFILTDRLTIGGMDDFLTIRAYQFAPSLMRQAENTIAEFAEDSGSTQSRGALRFSGYAIYQQREKLALIGRIAFRVENFSTLRADTGYGGVFTLLRAGVQYSPRRWFDLGINVGWDDVAELGSFGPNVLIAIRI